MMIRNGLSMLMVMLVVACAMVPQEQDEVAVPEQATAIKIPTNEPLSDTGNTPYSVDGIVYTPQHHLDSFTQEGTASWYGKKFHGRKTSSGEIYNMYQHSAAHRTLPIPSYIKVTNLKNNRSLTIRVNDRGPFIGDRILDLSYAAARDLGFVSDGTTRIIIESITKISNDLPNPNAGLIYLQTGVYSVYDNAKAELNKIKSLGYETIIEKRPDELFSVRIGPFASAQLAYNEKLNIEKSTKTSAMLVIDKD